MLVLLSNEVDGESKVTKAARSSDSVQIRLTILREVEVDNHVDG